VKQKVISESVCAGHSDKIADQISDAILDEALRQDAASRTAIEVIVAENRVVLAGEIKTKASIDFAGITREQIRRLGYSNPDVCSFGDWVAIDNYIHEQHAEVAMIADDKVAADQGVMFGYACVETPELMPLSIVLAHRLTRAIDSARETGKLPYILPDGKAQVVVDYTAKHPVIEHVTIAVAYSEKHSEQSVEHDIYEQVVKPSLRRYGYTIKQNALSVNGGFAWHKPGPMSDTGLTGRKIVSDAYGGHSRVGGGAFSGKDPSKIDRSGAYAARFIAKNVVAAGLARECEVVLAYCKGMAQPLSFEVSVVGGKSSQIEIDAFAQTLIVPTVDAITRTLSLRQPHYLATAAYGHFGKEQLPWERVV
jgi:S-adenosylmethionine synthetase